MRGQSNFAPQNPPVPVFNRRCRLTQVDMYHGRKAGGWVPFPILGCHTHPFNGPLTGLPR